MWHASPWRLSAFQGKLALLPPSSEAVCIRVFFASHVVFSWRPFSSTFARNTSVKRHAHASNPYSSRIVARHTPNHCFITASQLKAKHVTDRCMSHDVSTQKTTGLSSEHLLWRPCLRTSARHRCPTQPRKAAFHPLPWPTKHSCNSDFRR